MPQGTAQGPSPDVLIIAGNARSLIANRGDLIRDMRAAGLEVAAAVPTADYLPEVEELGITIYPVEMGRTGINPLHDLKYLLTLRKLLRQVRPQVVFGYTIKPVVYGSLAARLAGVPRIYSMITGLGHVFTTENARNRRLQKVIGVLYRLRSEEHTSELQSRPHLVCRLLLEKKK